MKIIATAKIGKVESKGTSVKLLAIGKVKTDYKVSLQKIITQIIKDYEMGYLLDSNGI